MSKLLILNQPFLRRLAVLVAVLFVLSTPHTAAVLIWRMQIDRSGSPVPLSVRLRITHQIRVRIASPNCRPEGYSQSNPIPTPDCFSFHLFRLENVPTFSPGMSNTTAQRTGTNDNLPMPFPSVSQSEGSRTMHEVPIFPPADHLQVKIVPGGLTSSVMLENTKDEVDSAGCEAI